MNLYGAKAKNHMAQFRPQEYHQIEDKEAFFTEIGEEAQRQVSSTYSTISRPELGERDLASRMMAEELVNELIYPSPSEETEEPMDPNSAMAMAANTATRVESTVCVAAATAFIFSRVLISIN